MRFTFGILTGLTIAGTCHALTRTRSYSRIVRWVWLADVRRSDPHLYGRGARMTTPRHSGGYLEPGKQTGPIYPSAGCYIPGFAELKPAAVVIEKLAQATPSGTGKP